MKTKICKECGNEFRQFVRVEGKPLNLSKRSYCLECSPYGELAKNKKEIVDGKRECSRCKTFKPLEEFQLRGNKKNFRSCCTTCEVERVKEYAQNTKEKAVQYLGGKCKICGYDRCARSLHFHHLDPNTKEFEPANKPLVKWETLRKELEKCVLLCANCHGEVHAGIAQV